MDDTSILRHRKTAPCRGELSAAPIQSELGCQAKHISRSMLAAARTLATSVDAQLSSLEWTRAKAGSGRALQLDGDYIAMSMPGWRCDFSKFDRCYIIKSCSIDCYL